MNHWYKHKIRRKQNITFSSIDGEVILIHPNDGKYYSFNKVGSFIWNSMEHYITFDELIEFLMAHYEITKEQCEKEVFNFLLQLDKKDLLDVEEL